MAASKVSDYELLGVGIDADEKQLKRAYYRLIRQHTPDKDPEMFMKIREAYERLSAMKKSIAMPVFADPSDPAAAAMFSKIKALFQAGSLADAFQHAESCVKLWPDEVCFGYYAARMARALGRTGKAVRYAEKVWKTDPKNLPYLREYTMCCYSRGFTRKATAGFERGIYHGICDNEFLVSFLTLDTYYVDWSLKDMAFRKLVQQNPVVTADNFNDLLIAYSDQAMRNPSGLFTYSMTREEIAFLNFLKENGRYLDKKDRNLEELFGKHAEGFFTNPLYRCNLMDVLNQISSDSSPEKQETMKKEICRRMADCIEHDSRAPEYLAEFLQAPEDYADKPDVIPFAVMDYQLCLLKTRKKVVSYLPFLKSNCELVYLEHKEFFDILADEKKSAELEAKLRPEFRIMTLSFTGATYYKDFPEERTRRLTPGSDMKTILNRPKYSRPLVGRNDRCPCGSGRKFKKCCMGKGIYD